MNCFNYLATCLLFGLSFLGCVRTVDDDGVTWATPEELEALTVESVLVHTPQPVRVLMVDLSASIPQSLREKVEQDAITAIEGGWTVVVTEIGSSSGGSSVQAVRIDSTFEWSCNVPAVKDKDFNGSRSSPKGEMARYAAVTPHVEEVAAQCQSIAAGNNGDLEEKKDELAEFMLTLRAGQAWTDITGGLQTAEALITEHRGQIIIYSDMEESLPPGTGTTRTADLSGIHVLVYQFKRSARAGQVEKEAENEEIWTTRITEWNGVLDAWEPLILLSSSGSTATDASPPRAITPAPEAKPTSKAPRRRTCPSGKIYAEGVGCVSVSPGR